MNTTKEPTSKLKNFFESSKNQNKMTNPEKTTKKRVNSSFQIKSSQENLPSKFLYAPFSNIVSKNLDETLKKFEAQLANKTLDSIQDNKQNFLIKTLTKQRANNQIIENKESGKILEKDLKKTVKDKDKKMNEFYQNPLKYRSHDKPSSKVDQSDNQKTKDYKNLLQKYLIKDKNASNPHNIVENKFFEFEDRINERPKYRQSNKISLEKEKKKPIQKSREKNQKSSVRSVINETTAQNQFLQKTKNNKVDKIESSGVLIQKSIKNGTNFKKSLRFCNSILQNDEDLNIGELQNDPFGDKVEMTNKNLFQKIEEAKNNTLLRLNSGNKNKINENEQAFVKSKKKIAEIRFNQEEQEINDESEKDVESIIIPSDEIRDENTASKKVLPSYIDNSLVLKNCYSLIDDKKQLTFKVENISYKSNIHLNIMTCPSDVKNAHTSHFYLKLLINFASDFSILLSEDIILPIGKYDISPQKRKVIFSHFLDQIDKKEKKILNFEQNGDFYGSSIHNFFENFCLLLPYVYFINYDINKISFEKINEQFYQLKAIKIIIRDYFQNIKNDLFLVRQKSKLFSQKNDYCYVIEKSDFIIAETQNVLDEKKVEIVKPNNEFDINRSFVSVFTIVRQCFYMTIIARLDLDKVVNNQSYILKIELFDNQTKEISIEDSIECSHLNMKLEDFALELKWFLINAKISTPFYQILEKYFMTKYHFPIESPPIRTYVSKYISQQDEIEDLFDQENINLINKSFNFCFSDFFSGISFRKIKGKVILVFFQRKLFKKI